MCNIDQQLIPILQKVQEYEEGIWDFENLDYVCGIFVGINRPFIVAFQAQGEIEGSADANVVEATQESEAVDTDAEPSDSVCSCPSFKLCNPTYNWTCMKRIAVNNASFVTPQSSPIMQPQVCV